MTTTETVEIPYEHFRSNFPFENLRSRQEVVLREICNAYNSGVNVVVRELQRALAKARLQSE